MIFLGNSNSRFLLLWSLVLNLIDGTKKIQEIFRRVKYGGKMRINLGENQSNCVWVPCCKTQEFYVQLGIMRQNTEKSVSRWYTWWFAFIDTPNFDISSRRDPLVLIKSLGQEDFKHPENRTIWKIPNPLSKNMRF